MVSQQTFVKRIVTHNLPNESKWSTLQATGKQVMDRLRYVSADGIVLLFILLACLKLTFEFERIFDITLFDESGYLYAGTYLRQGGLMPPAWAPLYSVWYYFLTHFVTDNIALYYLNARLLTLLLPAIVYMLMRIYKISQLPSLVISWFLLISTTNSSATSWPKPCYFAAVIALFFFLLVGKRPFPTRSTIFLAIGALLCSYVRPEFFLTFVLLLGLYGVLLWKHRAKVYMHEEVILGLGSLIIASTLMTLFGLALLDQSNNRSFEAFCQHFALNWVKWNQSTLNPWTDCTEVFSSNFGSAQSILMALYNNPALFARHIASNLASYLPTVFDAIFVHHNVLLPASPPWTRYLEAYLLFFGAVLAIAWSYKLWWPDGLKRLKQQWLLLAYYVAYSIPATASAIIIYPRGKYILLQCIFIAITIALLVTRSTAPSAKTSAWRALILGTLAFALTPSISPTWQVADSTVPANLDNVRTINFIKSLQIRDPINLLEADGGYYIYLGDNFHTVFPGIKDTTFNEFLRQQDIEMIVVSHNLQTDSRLQDDAEWLSFLQNPAVLGYTDMKIPGTNRRLMIKNKGRGKK